jgi:hypothetical protein
MSDQNQQDTTAPMQDVWVDLRDRMNSAIDSLAALRHGAQATADDSQRTPAERQIAADRALHLNYKQTGVEQALTIWDRLEGRAIGSGRVVAWRTFTTEVFALWSAAPEGPTKQGIALALDYQRGYGSHVDAEPLVALARRQAAHAQALQPAR